MAKFLADNADNLSVPAAAELTEPAYTGENIIPQYAGVTAPNGFGLIPVYGLRSALLRKMSGPQ